MRRPFTRARHKAALAATTVALVAAGTAGAHAVPPRPTAAARIATTPASATPAADGALPSAEAVSDAGRLAAAPTAAQHPLALGPASTRVVAVRFRPGVKAAAVAAAVPLAAATRRFAATSRSVAPGTNAATYTLSSTTADAFISAMKARADVAEASYEVFAQPDTVPNDPLFWTKATTKDLDQIHYLKSIAAIDGWTLRGSAPVTIAVVDSGMDVGHPDLAAKVAVADRWNTFSQTANVTDTLGHGTFVAGVAGASTNNGIGIAGIGWSAKLMAVKVADASDRFGLTDMAEGIVWAADHGAKVINVSLGSRTGSVALANAVTHAQGLGALVVASAGNAAQDGNPVMYPAAYPGVVAVGASDADGHRAWFSEHGPWVTMAAPGVKIAGTTVRAGSTLWPKGAYNVGNGTSFAAAIVSGAAALVWTRSADATASQVRAAVVDSGRVFKSAYGLGTGRVTLDVAMQALPSSVLPTITQPASGAIVTTFVTLGAIISVADAQTGWYLDGEHLVGYTRNDTTVGFAPAGWAQGAHTLEARACTMTNVCASSGPSIPISLQAPEPVLSSPVDGDTVSGEVTMTVTSAASDFRVAIYDGSTRLGVGPPSQVPVNFTGRNGTHALQAVRCDSQGIRCDGARSAVVNVTSVSADVSGGTVAVPLFTPNGDGDRDQTSMTYTTGTTQDVTVSVVRQDGNVPVRTFPTVVGRPAGTWSVVWDGLDDLGFAAGDGQYSIRVDTVDAAGHAGLVTGSTQVDTTPPTLGTALLPTQLFYPVPDGYQDTFEPLFRAAGASTLALVVKDSKGAVRRTVTRPAASAGTTRVIWDGRDDHGVLVPSGTYTWTALATDDAGLTSIPVASSVVLSPLKLTIRTKTLTYAGTAAWGVNAGPACAQVTTTGSSYPSGVWLKNTCAKGSTGISALYFHTRMPVAKRYLAWRLKTTGRSHSAPADVYGGIFNRFTNEYDFSGPTVRVPAGATTTRTLDLGRLVETNSRGQNFDVAVFVDNERLAPLTDWDLKTVSVTVTYQVLA